MHQNTGSATHLLLRTLYICKYNIEFSFFSIAPNTILHRKTLFIFILRKLLEENRKITQSYRKLCSRKNRILGFWYVLTSSTGWNFWSDVETYIPNWLTVDWYGLKILWKVNNLYLDSKNIHTFQESKTIWRRMLTLKKFVNIPILMCHANN